jgi:hypothetical protein
MMRYYFFFVAVLLTAPILGTLLKGYFSAIRLILGALRSSFIRIFAQAGTHQAPTLANGMRAEDLPPSLKPADDAIATVAPATAIQPAPRITRWSAVRNRMSSWNLAALRWAADLSVRWHSAREHARYARTHQVVMASTGHVFAPVRSSRTPMAARTPKRTIKAIQRVRKIGT